MHANNRKTITFFHRVEYNAPGHIKAASLSSPEAQVLTGPKVINLLNGIISLIDLGLNNCYQGFGEHLYWWCDGIEYEYYDIDEKTFGKLNYTPSSTYANTVVNELSLLLTGGRLNTLSKSTIIDAFKSESNSADGLNLAQKLIISTPEFHTSATVFDAT